MPSPTPPKPEQPPQPPAAVRPPRVRRRTKPLQRSTSGSAPTRPHETRSTSAPSADRAQRAGDPRAGWEIADLIAAGVLDSDPADPPVPISVWRATGPDERSTSPTTLYQGLSPTLAARLLAIYTDPGQTVVDSTSDPAVAGAAGAGARRYLDLALLHPQRTVHLKGQVGLILLRWPSTGSTTAQASGAAGRDPRPALTACAQLLSVDGHAVVILAPPAGAPYRAHARTLIPAARQAGLGYLQHLVVITAPTDQPSPARAAAQPEQDPPGATFAGTQPYLDLLVLILRHGTRP